MIFHAPPLTTYEECRAHINRLNAQHSNGPRTAEGKTRSSQNSFKHGLYSKQLIRPGEDPAEFDQLRATLRSEHQPVNTTEEILVGELAHHFWRLRRFREMEARAWAPETVGECIDSGLLALVTRAVASAERGFFRALTALAKLQKARGFVPQKQESAPDATCHHVEFFEEEAHEQDRAPAPTPTDDAEHDATHRLRSAKTPASLRRRQTMPSHNLA